MPECKPVNGKCARNAKLWIEDEEKHCGKCSFRHQAVPCSPCKDKMLTVMKQANPPPPKSPATLALAPGVATKVSAPAPASKPLTEAEKTAKAEKAKSLNKMLNEFAIDFLYALPTRLGGEMLIHPKQTTVGAVITARNEGDWVLRTIESMYAGGVDKVVLVDDNSEDGSCDPRKLPGEVILLRRKQSMGVGVGRNDAVQAADCDVCVTADAHVLVPKGSVRNMAEWANLHQCIVQPAITDVVEGKRVSYATNLLYCPKAGVFEHKYTLERPTVRYCRSGVMYGSVYVVPRFVYRRMGGFTDNYIYGYNEMDHTIRAAMCGVPIWNDTEVVAEHKFKREFNYDFSTRETVMNYAMSMFVCFEDETFDEMLWPAFEGFFGVRWKITKKDIVTDKRMLQEREEFQQYKILSDKEFFLHHVIWFTERDKTVRFKRDRQNEGI